ncbi:hypothetical protein CDL15_Pgr024980 [Punica granatum]|uniref:Uncharacterized protein n=1 Tax=Punica granatum TaxID=22663 RepID=A0A218W8B9_PUNGR|nr:hypothetical protein CDL15_Pgr024980 [Punica granatum]PKI31409.1 hypothetical protein CRG98_048196 [Punica granatum]
MLELFCDALRGRREDDLELQLVLALVEQLLIKRGEFEEELLLIFVEKLLGMWLFEEEPHIDASFFDSFQ